MFSSNSRQTAKKEDLTAGDRRNIVCPFFVNFGIPAKLQYALFGRLVNGEREGGREKCGLALQN